jgi:hypothetical protein
MTSKGLRFLTVILVLCLGSLAFALPGRAQGGSRYFPETGHYVRGDFLEFYESHPQAEQIYGFPITVAYPKEPDGRIVQYFEKARFELHPELPDSLRVQLSQLGKYMYTPGQPLPLPKNFPPCQRFPETGKQVCYAFLDFFNEQGGVEQFGYPLSDFELQDSRIVQYFQNARFEWHPEMPPGKRVVLSNLGNRYFQLHGSQAKANIEVNAANIILDLHLKVFLQDAISPLEGQQTVTALVRDQTDVPVAGAIVVFTVRLPTGEQLQLPTEVTTDGDGLAQVTFAYDSAVPGIIQVWADATYENKSARSRNSFRVW